MRSRKYKTNTLHLEKVVPFVESEDESGHSDHRPQFIKHLEEKELKL